MTILLPVMLAAFMILSDVVIKHTAQNTIEQSVENAAYTVLGGYSLYLMDNYGIYAYCTGPGQATEKAMQCLERNLEKPGFYDFKIKELKIVKSKNLTQEGVMTKILETTAQDSVYESIVKQFKEKLQSITGASKAAEIVRYKMRFDESATKIKECYEKLSSLINGAGEKEIYVNLPKDNHEFYHKLTEFYEYYEKIRLVLQQISSLKKEVEEKEESALRLISLEETLGKLRHEAANVYEQGVGKVVKQLRETNRETLETLEQILKEKVNINYISENIQRKINAFEDCPEYLKIILTECIETISHIEEAFIEQIFEEIKVNCENNLNYLEEVAKSFSDVIENEDFNMYDNYNFAPFDYKSDLKYSYSSGEQPGIEEDIRGFFEAMGKKVLQKRMGEDKTIPIDKILPSAHKKQIDETKEQFDVTTTGNNTQKVDTQIETFTNKAAKSIRNTALNFCINEYILQNFKHNCSNSSGDTLNRFFKNEIEYIIWGANNQNSNLFFTKAAIMGTRFALNTLHVYTDTNKKIKANSIATATAGWWTGGAGIPIMSNLIKCAWAVAESGIDVSKLCSGKEVAIVKRGGDWITDIGVKKAGPKTPDILKMDYEDHLRMILLTVVQRDKELRMLDIIDLNSRDDFQVENAFTEITIRAKVSCMSLIGERHEIEVCVTKEY